MEARQITPVRYARTMETSEDDESQTFAELKETMLSISRTTRENAGRGMRAVHAKCHGLLNGEMQTLADLPEKLAQGVFATAGSVPVVIRLSTSPGDVLGDTVSTPRGFALKMLGVKGERLDAAPGDTQDFVLVNGPALNVPDAKHFLKNMKMLAPTTDKAEGAKKAFSAMLRGTEKLVEAVGKESATTKSLGGHPLTHILGETFYSQVPILYGPYMAKIQVAPVSPELAALKDVKLDLGDDPDGLRHAVSKWFGGHDAEWEVRVQLCTHLETMPIEDASAVWSEEESPYLPVARIHVPRQRTWLDEESQQREDRLFFNPWHCLAAHRPLGSINRARRTVYAASAEFRAAADGVAVAEPHPDAGDFSGQ